MKTELLYGDAKQVANTLSGDNPPTEIPELRCALANAMTRICVLEVELEHLGERFDSMINAATVHDGQRSKEK